MRLKYLEIRKLASLIQSMLITILFFLLISNAVTLKQEKSTLFSRAAIIGLLFTIVISSSNLYIKSLDKTIGIYGGLLNINTFSQSFNIFVFLISGIILVLTAFFARKVTSSGKLSSVIQGIKSYNKEVVLNRKTKQYNITEYALIILFIVCGAVFLISAGDLISIFLAIELQSYGLYILSTLYRDSELATGSGLTYFLLGGLSSCFILLGSAILYANSGSTNLDSIYIITDINNSDDMSVSHFWYKPNYLYLSFIIISVGFLFKISAAPFHFWSPDVYDGIPTIVTTYVAIVTKISILAFLLELVCHTNYTVFEFYLKNVLLISSVLSLIIGSLLGLTQFRIKRLLAYSTISHIGFILLALLINSAGSIQSYIFYILQYSLSNLNAFVIIISIGFSLYFYTHSTSSKNTEDVHDDKLVDFNNSPLQLISQLKGYFYVNPFIAVSLSITLLSFIGIPPVIGFFAKQMVLSAALDAGYVFITFIGIITSVIGAVYYLNIITQMFFYKEEYNKIGNNYYTGLTTKSPLSPSKESSNWKTEKRVEQHKNLFKDYYDSTITMTAYETPLSNKTSKQEAMNKFVYGIDNISIASTLSGVISIITLLLVLFIFTPMEWFNVANILTLTLLA